VAEYAGLRVKTGRQSLQNSCHLMDRERNQNSGRTCSGKSQIHDERRNYAPLTVAQSVYRGTTYAVIPEPDPPHAALLVV
jgi:hypothetical protein